MSTQKIANEANSFLEKLDHSFLNKKYILIRDKENVKRGFAVFTIQFETDFLLKVFKTYNVYEFEFIPFEYKDGQSFEESREFNMSLFDILCKKYNDIYFDPENYYPKNFEDLETYKKFYEYSKDKKGNKHYGIRADSAINFLKENYQFICKFISRSQCPTLEMQTDIYTPKLELGSEQKFIMENQTILLSKNELSILNGILLEVCYGITIKNLINALGASEKDVEKLFEKIRSNFNTMIGNKINIIFHNNEILIINNAFNIIHAELGSVEFQTRTGHWKMESILLLKKLTSYIQKPFDSEFLQKNQNYSLSKLLSILEWCGLQTIKEIQEHILPGFNNGEFGEYKYLFENLEANRTNKEFFQIKLPIELVVKIIDTMGMVLFYRSDENALFSINYEHQKPDEIGVFIRSNGYDAILNYENHDERAMKTSDALIEYGFEIVEKAYERTRVKL